MFPKNEPTENHKSAPNQNRALVSFFLISDRFLLNYFIIQIHNKSLSKTKRFNGKECCKTILLEERKSQFFVMQQQHVKIQQQQKVHFIRCL